MAEVLLFHHALGLTSGCGAFADDLRDAGHVVHMPDLYEGKTFDDLEAGVGYAEDEVGIDTILERGREAAEELPSEIVYGGFSLGVLPAQMLAQTRPGSRGAFLLHSAVPLSEFGGSWPAGVPLQIHIMEHDPFALEGGDLDAAREIVKNVADAELFLYPGDVHLFADRGLPGYDEEAATRMKQNVLGLLARADDVAV